MREHGKYKNRIIAFFLTVISVLSLMIQDVPVYAAPLSGVDTPQSGEKIFLQRGDETGQVQVKIESFAGEEKYVYEIRFFYDEAGEEQIDSGMIKVAEDTERPMPGRRTEIDLALHIVPEVEAMLEYGSVFSQYRIDLTKALPDESDLTAMELFDLTKAEVWREAVSELSDEEEFLLENVWQAAVYEWDLLLTEDESGAVVRQKLPLLKDPLPEMEHPVLNLRLVEETLRTMAQEERTQESEGAEYLESDTKEDPISEAGETPLEGAEVIELFSKKDDAGETLSKEEDAGKEPATTDSEDPLWEENAKKESEIGDSENEKEDPSETLGREGMDDGKSSQIKEVPLQGDLSDAQMSEPEDPSDTLTPDSEGRSEAPEPDAIELWDGLWMAGFVREGLTYTGKTITQDLRIYQGDTLLTKGKQYSLTYRNNVKAGKYDDPAAPSVTISLRGAYSGKRTFYYSIAPVSVSDATLTQENAALTYNKKVQRYSPKLSYQGKTLSLGKDYNIVYDVSEPTGKENGVVTIGYRIYGTGNFTGEREASYAIVSSGSNLSKAKIKLEHSTVSYFGSPILPEDIGITVTLDGRDLGLEDVRILLEGADGPGTGLVRVLPQLGAENRFAGEVSSVFRVVGGIELEDETHTDPLVWMDAIPYSKKSAAETGIVQNTIGLLLDRENNPLVEGVDYRIEYRGNRSMGNASAIFTGLGKYRGSFSKGYTIVSGEALFAAVSPSVRYEIGGAVPNIEVTDSDGTLLEAGIDYELQLLNDKTVGTASYVISGKGNYRGAAGLTGTYEVLPGDLADCFITVSDREYSPVAEAYRVSPVITDQKGTKLKVGRDYEISGYTYENSDTVLIPQIGTEVTVTVTGIGAFEGSSASAVYRIYEKGKQLDRLYVDIDPQSYTGSDICPLLTTGEEPEVGTIHLYASAIDRMRKENELIGADCAQVLSYENNREIGTARVTLQGRAPYGGTKTVSFRILKREQAVIPVKAILMEESLELSCGEERKLMPTLLPEHVTDPEILWTSSDPEVVFVDRSGNLTANHVGEAKITAWTRSSGAKAICHVTVTMIPITEAIFASDEISGEVGDCMDLVYTYLPENGSLISTEWTSSNSSIASVSGQGRVTLRSVGMTVIKLSINNGQCVATCKVTVTGGEEPVPDQVVRPQEFGALPGDSIDDTAAFNKAFAKAANEDIGVVYVPAGVYLINVDTSINPRSDTAMIMEDGAVLKALPSAKSVNNVIRIGSAENVTIRGGSIVGERYSHNGSQGEWGMGIGVYDSTGIEIRDVEISECWGDGIYLGSDRDEYTVNAGSTDIFISGCDVHHNRRNNLSIVCADRVVVDQSSFRYASGTAPQYGIDIETNNVANPCEHILISDTQIEGNETAALVIETMASDINLFGCTLKGDFTNYDGKNVTLHNTTIRGEVNLRRGVAFSGNCIRNSGSDVPDTLVAEYVAGITETMGSGYKTDSGNVIGKQLIRDDNSPSGKALRLERLTAGTHDAGVSFALSDLSGGVMNGLEEGTEYRFEYTVKGSGQWAFISDQTSWYPCIPSGTRFETGAVNYRTASGRFGSSIMLYAVDRNKGMWLEISSYRVYRVN